MLEYPLSPSDSEEEDTCQVYWETKSILDDHPHPLPPPHIAKPRLPPPVAASTPLKPKRSTTTAALTSPSTSSASARAVRLAKRTRRGKEAPPDASQRVDAGTLKLVSQLAARFNQRGQAGTSLREKSVSVNVQGSTKAAEGSAPSAKGKGKESLQQQDATLRSTTSATSHLTSSKSSLTTTTSTLSTTSSTKTPPAFPTRPSGPPRPVSAVAAPKPVEADDFDSYFDDFDDQVFELALSQLEATGLPSSQDAPPPPPAPIIAPRRAAVPAPKLANRSVVVKQQAQVQPMRSSPRLSVAATASTTARKPPPPQPQLSRSNRAPAAVPIVKAPPLVRPASKPQLIRGSSSTSSIIIGGGGEMDENARREMDQLVEGCIWDDDDEDF